MQMQFSLFKADLIHTFYLGVKSSFPEYRKGSTEYKVKSGDCVQDVYSEAYFTQCSFSRNEVECAERHCISVFIEEPAQPKTGEIVYEKTSKFIKLTFEK